MRRNVVGIHVEETCVKGNGTNLGGVARNTICRGICRPFTIPCAAITPRLPLRVLFAIGADELIYKVAYGVPHATQVARDGDAVCPLPPGNSGRGGN